MIAAREYGYRSLRTIPDALAHTKDGVRQCGTGLGQRDVGGYY